MSEPLLNVMKIMLLAGLYLFFIRVLWSVYNELRDPRVPVARAESAAAMNDTLRRRQSAAAQPAPVAPAAPVAAHAPAGSASSAGAAVAVGVMVGQLTVIEPAEMAGISWAIGNEITIGRASTNGIRLDDTYVSGVHARLFAGQDSFFIEDLDSRNGTLLNGDQLTATTMLEVGDQLRFGATALEFS